MGGAVAAKVATVVSVRGGCFAVRVQDGWTAVMVAAQNGHESTVGLLLDRGADMEARNKVSTLCWSVAAAAERVPVSATGGVCACLALAGCGQ